LLRAVCARLARMIVLDGEGLTKLVEIVVTGARTDADALRAADAIANSPLVKTAWYGQDLNWGRIVAAAGYAGVDLDQGRIALSLNGRAVVRRGRGVTGKAFERAAAQMKGKELRFELDLGVGQGTERILTCDLTHKYISINADYPT
jgi:glutamate N-acetyltransferase/amino-acid N-acetyltransferase